MSHYSFLWNGIEIHIRLNADFSASYRHYYGQALAHLEIQSGNREPLPITETGYLSHWTLAENIDVFNSAAEYVRTWLDDAAKSTERKESQAQAMQLSLF